MKFVKENINPNNLKCGDCSVRAIAKSLGKDWIEVYDDLCEIGRVVSCLPNDDETIKVYLQDYESGTCVAKKGKKRLIPKDFKKGTYVLAVARHWTCVSDGVLYDIWDCRNKCVYRYWKISD